MRRWGGLWELGIVLFGLVSALMLVVGVVEQFEFGHHSLNFWLVAGLLCTNVAALVWGYRGGRPDQSSAATHIVNHGTLNKTDVHIAPDAKPETAERVLRYLDEKEPD